MGSMVKARCDCGYDEKFPIGGGMENFELLCLFPCLCRRCSRIVPANLLESQVACPVCKSHEIVPYDQSELCEQQGSDVVASWNVKEQIGRELKLTDGAYFCPACSTFGIRFFEGDICWD